MLLKGPKAGFLNWKLFLGLASGAPDYRLIRIRIDEGKKRRVWWGRSQMR